MTPPPTPPPAALIRLYLASRQTRRALLLLAGTAVLLRASHPVTADTNLFARTSLILITVIAAAVIATSTASPFGEAEKTAGSPLSTLRLTQLALLTTTAVATLDTAAELTHYGITTTALLRDLAGMTGLALLTATLLGAHLAWTLPLGYVLYCAGQLDVQSSTAWTWPTRPGDDHTATTIALILLAAGIATLTITGPRRPRTENP